MPEIRHEERDSSVRWHSNNAIYGLTAVGLVGFS